MGVSGSCWAAATPGADGLGGGATAVSVARGRKILSNSAAKSDFSAIERRATSVGAMGARSRIGGRPKLSAPLPPLIRGFVDSRLLCSRTAFHLGQNFAVRYAKSSSSVTTLPKVVRTIKASDRNSWTVSESDSVPSFEATSACEAAKRAVRRATTSVR